MAAKGKKAKGGGAMGGGAISLYLVLFVAATLIVPEVVGVVLLGLVPTGVAWMVHRSPHRHQHLTTLFAFNLAGVMPYIVGVVAATDGTRKMMALLSDTNVYLAMWGAAALGYVVIMMAPHLAATILQFRGGDRLRLVRREQQRLINDWGSEVMGTTTDAAEGGAKSSNRR